MNGTKKALAIIPLIIILLFLAGCAGTSEIEPAPALLENLDSAVQDALVTGKAAVPDLLPASPSRETAAQDGTLTRIYQEVNPSVVHIQVAKNDTALSFGNPEIPNLPDLPDGAPKAFGEGSGFVWDEQGYIITNNHVIDGAEKITVVFADDASIEATVVGADPDSDLAVLKVDVPAVQLHPVRLGDSDSLQVGELAIAIGNPFGQEGTMTVGIISALGRLLAVDAGNPLAPRFNIPDIIQTDAAINPGNSGGVLLNARGEVIGVTTAIISATRASAGVGFAVPSAIVEQVVPVLIAEGRYDHPYLGISGGSLTTEITAAMDLPEDQHGVLVASVVPGGPADEAGLKGNDEELDVDGFQVGIGGDVITAIDDQPLNGMDDLIAYLERSTHVGQRVDLTLLRDGEEMILSVELAARPQREPEPIAEVAADGSNEGPGAGSPAAEKHAWLGILVAPLSPEIAEAMDLPTNQSGLIVQQVIPGSPADDAGLRGSYMPVDVNGAEVLAGGDVIIAVEGTPIANPQQLIDLLGKYQAGDEIKLDLLRDGEQITIEVILGNQN